MTKSKREGAMESSKQIPKNKHELVDQCNWQNKVISDHEEKMPEKKNSEMATKTNVPGKPKSLEINIEKNPEKKNIDMPLTPVVDKASVEKKPKSTNIGKQQKAARANAPDKTKLLEINKKNKGTSSRILVAGKAPEGKEGMGKTHIEGDKNTRGEFMK
eukprot:Ihof_evm3s283 gene=Ihof_evmTU3s283